MKTKLPIIVALTTCITASGVQAQEAKPPQIAPPPGAAPTQPGPPPAPGDRRGQAHSRPEQPMRPDRPGEPGRPPEPHHGDANLREAHGEFGGRYLGKFLRPPAPKGPRAFLGVVTSPLPSALSAQLGLAEGFGLLVEDVLPDSPAATAGIQKHDVLKLLNDQQLVDPGQLAALVRTAGKDKDVSITLIRKGEEQQVTVKIGERVLPERRPLGFGNFNLPRVEELGRSMEEKLKRLPDQLQLEENAKRLQENARRMQEHAKELQDRAMKWQQEVRERIERGDVVEAIPPLQPVPPADILKEAKPEGGAKIKVYGQTSTTTVDGQKARLLLKDNDGEVEVSVENGKRTLTAKDPDGKVVFSGPVNTEEERKAVPEKFAKKLDQIQVRQDQEGNSVSASVSSSSPGDEYDASEVQ